MLGKRFFFFNTLQRGQHSLRFVIFLRNYHGILHLNQKKKRFLHLNFGSAMLADLSKALEMLFLEVD